MNNTDIAAHMGLVDRYIRIPTKERRALVEASARKLAAPQQAAPGFVMVPVEVVKFLTGEGPLDGLWFGEHPFGLGGGKYWWRNHLPEARPLPASPTAPSTEASEPVRDERADLIAQAGEEMSFEAWFKTMCPVDGINAKIAARAAWQAARALKGTP